MRWFKHMTASGQDEKLILLKDEFGMEGYGVYWAILEVIGAQINKGNETTFVEFSVKSWRKVTEFSPQKLNKFVTFCNKINLFVVTFNQKSIRVECPNILKYKDEYSKKSKKTPDKLRTDSGQTPHSFTDTEIDTEIDKDLKDNNVVTLSSPAEKTGDNLKSVSTKQSPACPHQEIVDLYHEILPMLPQVKIWSEARKKLLRSRWREKSIHQDVDFWRRYFNYISKSGFLTGKISAPGRNPFLADLEWLIRPSNFIKVIEEKYHKEKS